ncbi:hypothetical protein MACH05_24020 [Qipengyuania nanhaisediminis]
MLVSAVLRSTLPVLAVWVMTRGYKRARARCKRIGPKDLLHRTQVWLSVHEMLDPGGLRGHESDRYD